MQQQSSVTSTSFPPVLGLRDFSVPWPTIAHLDGDTSLAPYTHLSTDKNRNLYGELFIEAYVSSDNNKTISPLGRDDNVPISRPSRIQRHLPSLPDEDGMAAAINSRILGKICNTVNARQDKCGAIRRLAGLICCRRHDEHHLKPSYIKQSDTQHKICLTNRRAARSKPGYEGDVPSDM